MTFSYHNHPNELGELYCKNSVFSVDVFISLLSMLLSEFVRILPIPLLLSAFVRILPMSMLLLTFVISTFLLLPQFVIFYLSI